MPRPFQYREAVLSLLKENPIHPTVDWVYTRLRQEHPRVSLATVYRTLRILVSEGLLCELPFGSSEARFGLVRKERHYHFVCEACHRIYDLPLPHDSHLEEAVRRVTGYEVNRHTVEFYGRCLECLGEAGARPLHDRRPPQGRGPRKLSIQPRRKEKKP